MNREVGRDRRVREMGKERRKSMKAERIKIKINLTVKSLPLSFLSVNRN